jgi:hypothetical protein
VAEAIVKQLFLAAALVALQSGQMIAAEALPEFKIETCRQAEESGSASRNAQSCFQDEEKAKDTLKQNWASWPAPGSEDTKFGVTMGPEVGHAEAEVYAGVQA